MINSHTVKKSNHSLFSYLLLYLSGVYATEFFKIGHFFLSTFAEHPKTTNEIPKYLKELHLQKNLSSTQN